MSQRFAWFSLHHTLLCFTYVSEPWRSKPLCFTRFLQWFWSLFLGWSRFLDFIDFVWFLEHFSSKSLCFAMIFNDFCYVSMLDFKINECYSVLLHFRCIIDACVLQWFMLIMLNSAVFYNVFSLVSVVDFSMIFIWFSLIFIWFSLIFIGFHWFSYDFHWFSFVFYRFAYDLYRFSYVFIWFSLIFICLYMFSYVLYRFSYVFIYIYIFIGFHMFYIGFHMFYICFHIFI